MKSESLKLPWHKFVLHILSLRFAYLNFNEKFYRLNLANLVEAETGLVVYN